MPDPGTSRKATIRRETKDAFRRLVGLDLYSLAKHVLYANVPRNQLVEHFHKPLCQWVQTTPYSENLYLLSRGTFKTSLLTMARTVQRILAHPHEPSFRGRPCGPNVRMLIASSKSEHAEDMLLGVQAHLTHPKILWAFPDVLGRDPSKLPEWTKSGLTVLRPNRTLVHSTVKAVGLTGELASQHYDHGTFDDCVGKENSQTRDLRESVVDFMQKIRPLFDPGNTKDYIGTHWHHSDWYMRLKEDAQAGRRQIGIYQRAAWESCPADSPGAADVAGHGWVRPTFPERFCLRHSGDPRDYRISLLDERALMGPADFASHYLLDPVPADTVHFPRAALVLEQTPPPLEDLWIALTIDPAISDKRWADYAALAVGGFDLSGALWLLELKRMKRDEHGLVAETFQLARRFPTLMAVGIEATGFQKAYRTLFELEGRRRGTFLPVVKLERDTRITKNVRIGGLQAPWVAGQVHALRSCEALTELLEEADRWRPDRESAHDDLLDAVVDLYQVRGSGPGSQATLRSSDPEIHERLLFEEQLLAQRPTLDRLALREAWRQEQRRLQETADREAVALGTGGEEWLA